MPEEKEQQEERKIFTYKELMQDQYFKRWYPVWIRNAMENYAVIRKEFEKKDRCISSLPRPMNKPAIILGAGPSLDDAAPLLKDWPHPIFCPTSISFVPKRWERMPDYICAFDSLHTVWNRHLKLNEKNVSWHGSTLITHPNAESKLIKNWKWDKYYFRRIFERQEFFEFTFPLMYPFIRLGIKFSGNVVNNSLTIASLLGYSPVFLVGVDLGWRDDNNIKAQNWEWDKQNKEWMQVPKIVNKSGWERKKNILFTTHDGVRSWKMYINFKNELLRVAMSNKKMKVIDCSNGLITELPRADIKQVIEEKGYNDYGYDPNQVLENAKNFFNQIRDGSYFASEGE